MVRPRVAETDHGIQGEFNVHLYDRMQRRFRDRGWIETSSVIASGIDCGHALEVGPGPGYLGLEWLKKTQGTTLVAVEISPDMIALAKQNALDYDLSDRVRYVQGDAQQIPLADASVDAVFTNGSLHEWAHPDQVLREINRVLRPGGRYYVSDLRRDAIVPIRWFLYLSTYPPEIRPGLLTSLGASYTPQEAQLLSQQAGLRSARVKGNLIGLEITGVKPNGA